MHIAEKSFDKSLTMPLLTILLVAALLPLALCKPGVRPACGPTCDIYCPYGNVIDAKGCPLCRCKTACRSEQAPLDDYLCGRVPNRRDCPSTHYCVIARDDSYAVCCPRKITSSTSPPAVTTKPGSCPAPNDLVGPCIAYCSNDSDCEGNLKCCGGCPLSCVDPIL